MSKKSATPKQKAEAMIRQEIKMSRNYGTEGGVLAGRIVQKLVDEMGWTPPL